jgi:iron complex transport system ATP-binding protein
VLCQGVRFTIELGEFWCVLGRNGAGKTTLLRALAGLRKPEEGSIILEGRKLADWDRTALARARAYLPQAQRDAFSSTVLETVLTGGFPHRTTLAAHWRFADRHERDPALAILRELGLESMQHRDVLSLSGGERQRVALAAMLLQDAPILLLDEPTSHLDVDKQFLVMNVLSRRLARPKRPCAAFMSVHDINLAARFATHIVLFSDDAAVLSGPVDEILTAENLSRAYHHRVMEIPDGPRRWFVPN